MKRYIQKISGFLFPVLLGLGYTELFFTTNKGDLLKVGYIADFSGYDKKVLFEKEIYGKKFFRAFSELESYRKQKFNTLVIGDSYSDQGNYSFTNYLAEMNDGHLLYLDRNLHKNPFQALIGVLNSDFLDSIQVENIIVQSAERYVASRTHLNPSATLSIDSLDMLKKNWQLSKLNVSKKIDPLFSDRMLKFTSINLGYHFDDNAFYSEAYIVETRKNLFTVDNNDLIFFYEDLTIVQENSDLKTMKSFNIQLNSLATLLSKKGIKLIILISPDKYGMYYEEIVRKEQYPQSRFFEIFNSLPKSYEFVQSNEILKKAIRDQKDIYYYDDTHWSPVAAKAIAKELNRLIDKNARSVQ